MGFNCLKARSNSRRQFTFYHKVSRSFRYSFYWPWKDESLSWPWNYPVVFNTWPQDWESSTLTTRPLLVLSEIRKYTLLLLIMDGVYRKPFFNELSINLKLFKKQFYQGYLSFHSQIENSVLNVDLMSKSWPPHPNLDVNVCFWPKQRSTFSQMSIAIVNSNENSILFLNMSVSPF